MMKSIFALIALLMISVHIHAETKAQDGHNQNKIESSNSSDLHKGKNLPTGVSPNGKNSIAQPPAKTKIPKKSAESNYQDIIDDYKQYLAQVPDNVRNEIINFRKELATIQKKKKELYKKLSKQAQNFLKVEEGYRKKLPLEGNSNDFLNDKLNLKASQINKVQ
ncbi:MAG: hypothetical protein SFT68_03345 [Rickettsiaceae bacterium]|nr:hypothetical protein [Rickettsiaceae bacterium]